MITASDIELRAGSRILLEPTGLRVQPGERIGLVGRNGAGKTTLLRSLAGESLPYAGSIDRRGEIGYLPQDPRTGDLSQAARDRILSARGLDAIAHDMAKAEVDLETVVAEAQRDRLISRYARLEERFAALGGYSAAAEAARISSNLGLPDRVLSQPLGTLSGGQRRRVELARILFGGAPTLLLDEPTNHLDADSISWLRGFLRRHDSGMVLVSHDVGLLEQVVNRVWHLDAVRAEIDPYAMGWKGYLQAREADERRRHRERANATKKIAAMRSQADRMRATATKASAAHQLDRRAQRLADSLAEERVGERVAKVSFPTPAKCGKVPLTATGLSKTYGSLEVFTDVDLAIDRGSRVVVLGLNGAGKTTLLRLLAGAEQPDTGVVEAGHGLVIGYFAQEHDTLDPDLAVLEEMRSSAPQMADGDLRRILGTFRFSGEAVQQPVRTLSGGEKTRLALATLVCSGANVLLLDEPTNNLDPASREQVLSALATYEGAIVLVTHDEGAVTALDPQRVLLLPDATEDTWGEEYLDLVSLA